MIVERLTSPNIKRPRRLLAVIGASAMIMSLSPEAEAMPVPQLKTAAISEQNATDQTTVDIAEARSLQQAVLSAIREQANLDAERIAEAIPKPYIAPTNPTIAPAPSTYISVGVGAAVTAYSPSFNEQLAKTKAATEGWIGKEWVCLDTLWTRESHFKLKDKNPSSGAYGIPQAKPGNKMAIVAADWETNPETQIEWGFQYIQARYGQNGNTQDAPCAAEKHSEEVNWY